MLAGKYHIRTILGYCQSWLKLFPESKKLEKNWDVIRTHRMNQLLLRLRLWFPVSRRWDT